MRVVVRMTIVVFALTLAVCGQEASDPGTAGAIRALEKQWTVGQSRNDNRALDMIFDNALLYIEYGRLVSKGEYLARIKAQAPQVDQITMDAMIVRTFGNTAIVVGSYSEIQRNYGKAPVQRWKFIDTWVYKKNGWVLVAAGATPVAR